MTTPLFRIGHIYAIGFRATTIIGRYAGATKEYYLFKSVTQNKPLHIHKHELPNMVIDHIGSDKATVYC